MKRFALALAVALLAGCAGPRAYSGSTTQSTEPTGAPSSESSAGAGSAEPDSAHNGFLGDDAETQRRQFEAWEAGG